MDIVKMHETFRTLGQQKGMQLVRAILPEEIDVYINDVIAEKTRVEILNGINYSTQANGSTFVGTMTNINLFRNLYRNARFKINAASSDGLVKYKDTSIGYYEIAIPTINSEASNEVTLNEGEYFIDPMMYLGISVEYDGTSRGNAKSCRLISLDEIEKTLNDYCSKPDPSYPIATLLGIPRIDDLFEIEENEYDNKLNIYTGKSENAVQYINIKYIKKPNVVSYTNNVSCDLSEYSHYEIVEMAVQKYLRSIGINQGN